MKVSTGSKAVEPIQLKPTEVEESFFDQKLQELADKAEIGNPVVESEAKELFEEAKKKPKLMKRLQEFVQDTLKKPMLKKRIGLIWIAHVLSVLTITLSG